MTTILRWSRLKTSSRKGKRTGLNSRISMPLLRIYFKSRLRIGLLLLALPNPSKISRTFTPSLTLVTRWLMSSLFIESLRKLKYSMWMVLRAWSMALKRSSNFSCPFISRATELLCENVTPSARSCRASRLSAVTAAGAVLPSAEGTVAVCADTDEGTGRTAAARTVAARWLSKYLFIR